MYNEKFNSIRTREYDGSHITFSGMNPEIQLRKHQKDAVARIMYGGNSLLGTTNIGLLHKPSRLLSIAAAAISKFCLRLQRVLKGNCRRT